MAVVDVSDLLLALRFLGVIIRLLVVIVGIRASPQPSQETADAEFCLTTINKPVSR